MCLCGGSRIAQTTWQQQVVHDISAEEDVKGEVDDYFSNLTSYLISGPCPSSISGGTS